MKASDLLSGGFKVGVYDEDVTTDDTIASPRAIAVTEAHLRAGTITGITNNSTLTTLTVTLTKQ